jgi:segregation and condensation protein A
MTGGGPPQGDELDGRQRPAAADHGGEVETAGAVTPEEPAAAAPPRRPRTARVTPGLLPESWRVHLPIVDGPLDLLLHLVKINEVEITEIPVAKVCDQFHEYLMLMEELNLDVAGEYIYEAALLIHLKSRMLLPRQKTVDGEEQEDPRQELVERLLEYQRLKEAAQSLGEVDSVRGAIWTRQPGELDLGEPEEEELDFGEVSLFDLLGALKKALDRYEREHPPAIRLRGEEYSVRGQFDRLLSILNAARPFDLMEDLRSRSCRPEAVAAFLAVLELARLSLVQVHQTEGGDILLYRTTREMTDSDRASVRA